jgi:hypothetical protein
MELLISLGFVSLAIAGFMVAVKVFAILPAPNYTWFQMEAYEKAIRSVRGDAREIREAAASFTD